MNELISAGKELVTLKVFASLHGISYRTVLRLKKRGSIVIYKTVAGLRTDAACHVLSQGKGRQNS